MSHVPLGSRSANLYGGVREGGAPWNAKGLGGEVCPIVKEINLTCGVDEVYMWVSVFGEGHLFKPWVIIMECRKRSAARRTVHARPPSSAGTSCSSTSALSSPLSK